MTATNRAVFHGPATYPPLLNRLLRAATAVTVLVLAAPARPNCCVFEDPLVAVCEVAARGGSLRLALETEYLTWRAAMDTLPATSGMSGTTMEVGQATLRAVVVYNPIERLNLVLLVPLVRRDWRVTGGGMSPESSTLLGPGDVDLGARISLWRQVDFVPDPVTWAKTRIQALAVSVGTSLPTGDDGAASSDVRLDQHAQIGTGSFGPYLGVLYRLQHAPWDLLLSATARARTRNGYGYRFGSALFLGAEVQYQLLPRVAIGLGADGRLAGRDTQDGESLVNSGGFVLSAVPGAYVDLGEGLWARVRVQVPTYTQLGGDQAVGPVFVAGLQYEIR